MLDVILYLHVNVTVFSELLESFMVYDPSIGGGDAE